MLDQRIAAYDQELANLGPTGGNQNAAVYHNLLINERNAIVTEQRRMNNVINNLANQRGQFREMKQQFDADVARSREMYLQTIEDVKKAVEAVTSQYADLGARPEVVKGAEGPHRVHPVNAEARPVEGAGGRHPVAVEAVGLGAERGRGAAARGGRRSHRRDAQRQGPVPDGLRHRGRADDALVRARHAARPAADRAHGDAGDRRRHPGHGQGDGHPHGPDRPADRQRRDVRRPAQGEGGRRPPAGAEHPLAVRLQVHPGHRPAGPDQGRAGRARPGVDEARRRARSARAADGPGDHGPSPAKGRSGKARSIRSRRKSGRPQRGASAASSRRASRSRKPSATARPRASTPGRSRTSTRGSRRSRTSRRLCGR